MAGSRRGRLFGGAKGPTAPYRTGRPPTALEGALRSWWTVQLYLRSTRYVSHGSEARAESPALRPWVRPPSSDCASALSARIPELGPDESRLPGCVSGDPMQRRCHSDVLRASRAAQIANIAPIEVFTQFGQNVKDRALGVHLGGGNVEAI
jgi:hypothetical protein